MVFIKIAKLILNNKYLDPPEDKYLECGNIPEVYATVDFGPTTEPSDAFSHQRKFSPAGPLVNSEFYPGWLDYWGQPHEKVDTKTIISAFNKILDLKANVNFYMFHGGTNFGFSNGQYLIIIKLNLININIKT